MTWAALGWVGAQAELVQQHLIIELCLQHAEFPAELW
eukprot:COSAG06_NODE_84_length_25090_cov_20.561042_16_plen_37_part_00